MPKKTTEEFIEQAIGVHGDRYDYSKVVYTGCVHKVDVICPKHGNFSISPTKHLQNRGCAKCYEDRVFFTTEKFIQSANKQHNNFYDYSKTEFRTMADKVTIICPEHGQFEQIANNHLRGAKCFECGCQTIVEKNTSNNETFIEKAVSTHNNFYDYSCVDYKHARQKVEIICPIHGSFYQTPNNHLSKSSGCPECGTNRAARKSTKTTKQFINEAELVHGKLWDYSLVKYQKANKHINIICPTHGVFKQTPSHHLSGQRCPICNETNGERDVRMFLENEAIEFEAQKRFDGCRDKYPLKFDFYLPVLNLLIEYDGLQHFESVDKFGGVEALRDRQRKDRIKNDYSISCNIPMLRIRVGDSVSDKIKDFLEAPKLFNPEEYYPKLDTENNSPK